MDFTPDRGTTFPTTRAKNIIQAHEGPGGVLGVSFFRPIER